MKHLRLTITCIALAGFGPFVCNDSGVEKSNTLLRDGQSAEAIEALATVEDDAPEVHLSRAVALANLEKTDEAKSALDQAYRLLANTETDETPPENAGELRKRIAFSRGILAIQAKEWDTAQVEFGKVLLLDPTDEDARWNLELAWFQANPPCTLRDDDHEADNTRANAKPYDPEKAQERLLCPANEDWYAFEAPKEALLYITVEGEMVTKEEGDTRDVTVNLYGPDPTSKPFRTALLKDGRATLGVSGVREAGVWAVQLVGPGFAEVKYSLKIEMVPPCPADDKLEDNDSPEMAKDLQDGDNPGLKACPGDADWYAVIAPENEGRRIRIQFDPSRGPLRATLIHPQTFAPVAQGSSDKGGLILRIPKAETPQNFLVEVAAVDERENLYSLTIEPDKNDGDKDQDKDQDKDKDKDKDEDQDKDKDQDKQDKQDKQDQQDKQDEQDKKEPKPEESDVEALLEALDKHEGNPQLEKMLRTMPAVPQMEDY